jgi:phage tail sheath protein FI
MTLNVGVNVIEVDGRASPTIQAAPTSVAAFIGLAERGAPNRPVRFPQRRPGGLCQPGGGGW